MTEREDRVTTRTNGTVAILTLSNPTKRNAVTPRMLDDLAHCIKALDAADGLRTILLEGTDGVFSSGYAIDQFPEGLEVPEIDEVEKACRAIEASPLVVIAAVEGYAVGAGLDLAIACDLRVAAANARFGITPVRLGIVYGWPGTARLVRLVGAATARELLLTGDLIDASRAESVGLTHRVVPSGTAHAVAFEWASAIGAHSRLALSGTKRTINCVNEGVPTPSLRDELLALRRQSIDSADARERRARFLAGQGSADRGTGSADQANRGAHA